TTTSLTASSVPIRSGAAPTTSSTNSLSGTNNLPLSVGLGVGLGVSAIVLLGGLWIFCFRRRRSENAMKAGYGDAYKEAGSYSGFTEYRYQQKSPQIPEL